MAYEKSPIGRPKKLRTSSTTASVRKSVQWHDVVVEEKKQEEETRRKRQEKARKGAHKMQVLTLQRRANALQKQLEAIEVQKQDDLQQIRNDAQRQQDEYTRLAQGAEQLTWNRQEIQRLKADNAKLRAQQDKLATNMRNLRINNLRLEQFGQDHADYHERLVRHHAIQVATQTSLAAQEQDLQQQIQQAQQTLDLFTAGSYAEHKSKHAHRTVCQTAVDRLQQADYHASLALTAFAALEKVEDHYQDKLEQGDAPPFPPNELRQVVVEQQSMPQVTLSPKSKSKKKSSSSRSKRHKSMAAAPNLSKPRSSRSRKSLSCVSSSRKAVKV